MYTNADQLLNKRDEFELRVKNKNPYVIGVNEVKPKNCKNDILPGEFNIQGYTLFHNFDTCPGGRGILLYIKEVLNPIEAKFTSKFEEGVFAEIKLNNNDVLLVSVLYRSEAGTHSGDKNNELLNVLLSEIRNKGYSHILNMGDFNFPLIDWESWHAPGTSSKEVKFIKCLQDNFYYQHVDKPTRVRGTDTPNILDLVLTTDDNVSDLEYESPLGKSDHRVLFFNFNCYAILKSVQKEKVLYDKADWVNLKKEVLETDWKSDLDIDEGTVNESWEVFKEKVQKLTEKHIPIRKYTIKGHRGKTPLDENTRGLISKKHALERNVTNNNSNENRRAYNRVRNKINNLMKKIKRNFERDLSKRAKKNPKLIFKYANSKSKVRVGIGDMHIDPNNEKSPVTSDDQEKAEIFSEFYQSVFTIEPGGEIPILPPREILHSMPKLEITESKISKILKKLKPDKTPGPDGLHPRFFRELADCICIPLCLLFNKTLSLSVLPDAWKRARVSAIYKKENKKLACNYRPVSLTSIICKVMETLIRDHIVEHMKKNRLFSDQQYGFISGRSTSLQLLTVMDIWTEALENGYSIDCIYMDFRKAFDVVPHRRLLGKLASYGISTEICEWTRAFLYDRFQTVTVNGKQSSEKPVISGIPQGSVLGPMLFVIFINDLPESVLKPSFAFLFADDTKAFRFIKSSDDCKQLQEDLDRLSEWSATWLIGYNTDKCKHMHIGRDKGDTKYYVNGEALKYTAVEKDIGVHVDDQLTFDKHIRLKCKKATSMFALVRRTFKFLDEHMFQHLYKALCRSHFDSCSAVWAPYQIEHIKLIEGVQRRVTKQIPGFRDMSYEDRLTKLKLPTLCYRRLRGDLIEVYKILNSYYDPNTCKFLKLWEEEADRLSPRNNSLAIFPQRATNNKRMHVLQLRVTNHWNKLPEDIVKAPSVNTFKNRLDKYYAHSDIYYKFDIYMEKQRYEPGVT